MQSFAPQVHTGADITGQQQCTRPHIGQNPRLKIIKISQNRINLSTDVKAPHLHRGHRLTSGGKATPFGSGSGAGGGGGGGRADAAASLSSAEVYHHSRICGVVIIVRVQYVCAFNKCSCSCACVSVSVVWVSVSGSWVVVVMGGGGGHSGGGCGGGGGRADAAASLSSADVYHHPRICGVVNMCV